MATTLGKVGIRNRGRFDASATYAAGEFVYYMGSTFIALQNLPAGMVPQHDGINWNFLAEGASVEQVLQNFAPIEDGATVSRAYPAGDYFLHEDVLYKTTTDIASGGAIIIGTNGNVIQVNIGEEMHALAKNFANEEDSATATTNYSVGQYVIYNEQFYKVTAAISAGQTLVPGTNIEATNVGAQLSALNDSLTNKTITLTSASQSNYTLGNIRARRNGNMIMILTTVNVVSPATAYGGVLVFTDLPTPSMPLSQVFPSWENDSSTTNSLRVYVNGDGTIGFRHGIANHTYDVYLIYPLA